jgi:hypothetical protein
MTSSKISRHEPHIPDDRLQHHRRDLSGMALERAGDGTHVVVRQDHRVIDDALRHPARQSYRRIRRRAGGEDHLVCVTVIITGKPDELRSLRECSRDAQRARACFGAC